MSMNNLQVTRGSVTESQTEPKDNLQTYTIEWEIPYREFMNNKSILQIRSPKFSTRSQLLKFDLKLQFVGVERKTVEIYYLSTTSEHFKSVLVEHYCKALNIHSPNFYLVAKNECEFVKANTWQYLTHLSKDSNVLIKKPYVADDGNLNLKFEFVVTIKLETVSTTIDRLLMSASQTPENQLSTTHANNNQLSKDFQKLFLSSKYSDVVMKSTDDKEFKVHKIVLVSRSPVLYAQFEHNFTESSTSIIRSTLESTVLHEVLSFIYTDTAPKLDEFPEKLLDAADFYQLEGLKNLCADVLQKKLNVDNAIEILQLADLHSAQKLKELALKFIKNAPLKLIAKTEGWSKLKSVDLVKEICDYCN